MRLLKTTIIVILFASLSLSDISFAEGLSVEYVDLLIEKFESLNDDVIEKRLGDMRAAFGSADSIEGAKKIQIASLSDEEITALAKRNITIKDIEDNFNALKTWEKSDRILLLDYIIASDKSSIIELNRKYTTADNSQTAQNGGSTPSGGSTSSNIQSGNSINSQGTVNNATVISNVNDQKKSSDDNVPQISEAVLKKPIEIIKDFESITFKDTEKHWSNEFVKFFAIRGIVNGKEEGKFYPDDTISRAEIIKILSSVIIEDENLLPNIGKVPTDVKNTDWYYNYVINLSNLGVLDDYDMLKPDQNPTREEIIDLIIKSLKTSTTTLDDDMKILNGKFKDEVNIDSKYRESMAIAVNLGIVKGVGDLKLDPKGTVTRAQVMVLTKNLYDYIIDHLNEGVNQNE